MGPLISQRNNASLILNFLTINCVASMGPLISQRNNGVCDRQADHWRHASMGPLISQRNNVRSDFPRRAGGNASMGPLISQRNNRGRQPVQMAPCERFNGAADFSAEQLD